MNNLLFRCRHVVLTVPNAGDRYQREPIAAICIREADFNQNAVAANQFRFIFHKFTEI